MAVTFSLLGNGQLAGTEGDLYLVPGATQAAVKSVTLHNTDVVTLNIKLYIKKSAGTSRKIVDVNLAAGYEMVVGDLVTLGAGDALRGYAGTAAKIDYTVSGVEKT